jgi:hypothetical protein
MTEENDTEEHVTEEDFLIRVRPVKTDSGTYTGEANFSVISCQNHDIPIDLYKDIEYVVKCMLSTIPLMEQDDNFRDFVAHYVDTYFTYEFDEREEVPLIENVDGNVITINFDTNTKGNA